MCKIKCRIQIKIDNLIDRFDRSTISHFCQQDEFNERMEEADQTITSLFIQTGNIFVMYVKERQIIHVLMKTGTIESITIQ